MCEREPFLSIFLSVRLEVKSSGGNTFLRYMWLMEQVKERFLAFVKIIYKICLFGKWSLYLWDLTWYQIFATSRSEDYLVSIQTKHCLFGLFWVRLWEEETILNNALQNVLGKFEIPWEQYATDLLRKEWEKIIEIHYKYN